jgi:hypothetical protein
LLPRPLYPYEDAEANKRLELWVELADGTALPESEDGRAASCEHTERVVMQRIQSRQLSATGVPPDVTPQLLRWLLDAGVDEFTLTVMGIHGETAAHADAFEDAIEPFVLGLARRRVLVDADGQGSTREVRIFAFNHASLEALLPFLASGLFYNAPSPDGWLEDFAFYRAGDLVLGVVTHLQEGTLRLTEVEHRAVARMGITSTKSDEWIGY